MNKALFEKVKGLCKDTGLSEKYLRAITEKMGGSVEDDSADEAAIEEVANQIFEIATVSQGEATRWASAVKSKSTKTDTSKKKTEDADEEEEEDSSNDGKSKDKPSKEDSKIVELEEKIKKLEQSKLAAERDSNIKAAQAKHGIPEWRMKGLHIPEDSDPDEFLADIKQDLITQNLIKGDETSGAKAATDKQIDEAADSLLETIKAK